MVRFISRRWLRYGFALGAVLVATLIAAPVQKFLGGRVPFITYFPLVMLVGVIAGTGPGIFSTFLSALAVAVIWMDVFRAPVPGKSADIVSLVLYLVAGTIITIVGGSLRQAQIARRETEGLLWALVDNTPGIMYLKDRAGKLRMINRRFAELAKKPVEDLIGKDDGYAFGDTPDVQVFRANDAMVLSSGQVAEFEEKLQLPDGEHIYLSIKVPIEYEGQTVLCGFSTDITDRKRAELRDRFLLALDDAVRPLPDAQEITHTAARMLGEHLGVDRCAYADVTVDQDAFNLTGDFTRPGIPSIVGQYRLADFGAEALRLYRINQPYIVDDVDNDSRVSAAELDSYRKSMIKAVIAVPLHKAGRFVAGMAVHQALPRHWRADEVDLLRTVAARCWESIERARIARDLRENEERLRMAQEAGGVGTFEYDIQRQISRGSEVFYRIFQAPPGATEYHAQDWARISHPEDRDGVFSALQRAIESPEIVHTSDEYRLLLPDGTVRWVSYNGRVTRDETGKAMGIIGTVADVTSRRSAEQALRQSETRFRALADEAPVPISVSRDGKHLYVNAAYRRCFGIARDQNMTGTSILAQIAAQDQERIQYNIRRRFAGEQIEGSYQFTGVRTDGRQIVMDVQVTQIQWPDGPASIAFLTDVSGQKQAQDRLRLLADAGAILSSSLQYERSLEQLARLVVPHLADWCAVDMVEAGDALRRVAVIHPDPAKVELAHEYHRRFPPHREEPGGTWQVISTGKTTCVPLITYEMLAASITDREQLRILKELSLRSYIGVPLMARGRVLGVITLVYAESNRTYSPEDVSLAEDLARRAAIAVDNATLFDAERAARAEAERASRLKDDFLATLSHELRTPLNAILGWSQILASNIGGRSENDLAEGLQTIERNARVQTQLIEDLLDMSRIVSGKLRLDVEQVMPADVVSAAIGSIAPAADAKGIRVEKVVDPSAGPVSGDPGRLQQAVWNLLTNAVKFTPANGRIQIVLSRINEQIELSVSDTGQGIRPEFLPHMFERFRQGDASTTRRHGGLGIGLALVKQLVELHGGTVRVASPGEGKGATFTIALPLAVARSQPAGDGHSNAATSLPQYADTSLTGLCILVVDDEPDARMLAKRILEERGATVHTATTAKEGIDLLRANRPNVILSDIGMPDEDGYRFISWVRSLPSEEGGHTPAAAFTAFARSEDRQRAFRAGYQSHLVKPVEPAELVTIVASLAGRMGTGNR